MGFLERFEKFRAFLRRSKTAEQKEKAEDEQSPEESLERAYETRVRVYGRSVGAGKERLVGSDVRRKLAQTGPKPPNRGSAPGGGRPGPAPGRLAAE